MGKTRGRKDRDNPGDETKLYLQEPCLERKIPETELISITEIPERLDLNEWLALHTIGFFEHVNLLYGTVSEFCTLSSCPEMIGPGPRTYLWVDDKGKKSRVSAPQYVDYVMTFVQKTANDETIFPTKHGHEFPTHFDTVIKKIHKLLFHVLAHIYHAHFREVVLLGLHAHLNSLFAHIIEFTLHYNTIEEKETEVLQDLIHAMKLVPSPNNNVEGSEDDEAGDKEASGDPDAVDSKAQQPEPMDTSVEEGENVQVEPDTSALAADQNAIVSCGDDLDAGKDSHPSQQPPVSSETSGGATAETEDARQDKTCSAQAPSGVEDGGNSTVEAVAEVLPPPDSEQATG